MNEYFNSKKGQRVAIWCMRYTYRGIVQNVTDDCVILYDPFAVEVSGRATNSKVETEDKIPSDLVINLGAVEIVCQPVWA